MWNIYNKDIIDYVYSRGIKIQCNRPCYQCCVHFWRLLWIAFTQIIEDAKRNHATILFDDVSDDDSIYDRTGLDQMNIMWNWEKVEQSVQKMLCQVIIVAMKQMLLTIVSTGKGKKKCGKVKSSTHIRRRWKNILTKFLAKHECHYTLWSTEMSNYRWNFRYYCSLHKSMYPYHST